MGYDAKLFPAEGIKGPFLLSSIDNTPEGNLVAKLIGSEQHRSMEIYLMSLRTEFRVADRIPNSFTYTYDKEKKSFIIKPLGASIDAIRDDLCNVLFPDSPKDGYLPSEKTP